MSPDTMLIGKRILSARVKAGLSQGELSSATGLSQPNISLYEHGKQKPTISALYSISKTCNVTCDYLLGLSDVMEDGSSGKTTTDDAFLIRQLLEEGELRIKEDDDMICLLATKDTSSRKGVEYLTLLKKAK